MIGNPLVRWLLGIDAIPSDAGALRLSFDRPFPPWAWALVVAAAIWLAWASYRRIEVRKSRRVILGCLRGATVILLALLLSGPELELPRERREPDSVLVLADRSRSMEVVDVARGGARVSRDQALRDLLSGPEHLLASPGDAHRVQWYGFAEAVTPLQVGPMGVEPGPAVGERTLLGSAIDQVLTRAGGRPVSAVVLLSDGRTTDPPDRALVRRLQSEGIHVLCVGIGADDPLGDMAVTQAQAPRRAFANDLVPVEAVVERRGPAAGKIARVELVDPSTGSVLDHVDLPAGSGQTQVDTVQFVARPGSPGDMQWEVHVRESAGGDDLVPANDRRTVPVTLVDRPLRALYVEGYPRWEYRYLKNLLQRETTIESAVMLLSADRNFAQEGNTPITRLPRTREEFERFDLVIIGDVAASFFTAEQLRELRHLVAERGAGLVWIGGARNTPRSWQGSALEDLLPFRAPLELERLASPVNMQATMAAQRLGVLRLADDLRSDFPEALRDPASGWSQLEWAQRIPAASIKPTAEVLGASVQSIEGSNAPLVLTMRYGAGSVLYLATDEVWRWRYARGETYPERFWLQLLRMLARPALAAGREDVQVAVEPGRATVGDAVRVEVELPPGPMPESLPLEAVPDSPGAAVAELEARPAAGGVLVATWTPEAEGRWTVRPRDPSLAARSGAGGVLHVVRSDRELRDAESDPALLRSLASDTGGRMVSVEEAREIVAALPNRSVVTEDPLREPLWSSPLALGALLVLLTGEWAGRRLSRLA